jgi:hypothetical protein
MSALPASISRQRLAGALTLALAFASIAPATAQASGGPEQFGPFVDAGSFIGFECDGFDIRIDTVATTSFTVWFDATGDVDRLLQRTRAPHDTLTNTVTGESIVVRGEFNEHVDHIVGTDMWEKTVTGFRYLVNVPGVGLTIRDVGRITYGDLEQTIVLAASGHHDLAYDADFQDIFCGALD